MKTLSELLYKTPLLELRGRPDLPVADVQFDSRLVQPGDLFVATPGEQTDGHKFIPTAIASGATAVVHEAPVNYAEWPDVTFVRVADARTALALICANFYDNPAENIAVVGVTGTNGKTTVATLLYRLFSELGYRSGLISTVCSYVGDEILPSTHTTPDPKALHELFARMVDAGCTYCFMEVSSHACAQKRIVGIPFKGGVFTNLTHDHLDYHGTFQNYLRAKQSYFDALPASSFAVTNLDDRNGPIMVQNTRAKIRTYALHDTADYTARLVENQLSGLMLEIEGRQVWFQLVGAFNAYNLLAIYATARECGLDAETALVAMSRLEPVIGRFQNLRLPNGATFIVDYAHTPDALRNVLETIRDVHQGKVITLVGCGGNRDRTKRPIMGKVAAEWSDEVILTSDNPRDEDPEAILEEMAAGVRVVDMNKVSILSDRRAAIQTAVRTAVNGDVVLVAGKGHETYQEVRGVRHSFDDREEILRAYQLIAEN